MYEPPKLSERQKKQVTDLQMKCNQELESTLQDNNFPVDEIPVDFIELLKKALRVEKERTLQCSTPVLMALHKAVNAQTYIFTLQEFGFGCNSIEDKTPEEIGVNVGEDYTNVRLQIHELGLKWQAIVKDLQDPIKARYKVLIERVQRNEPIIMP